MRLNIFDKLSFLSLTFVVILLPVFCLPFVNVPLEVSKGLLLVLGTALCLIFWAIARFIDGKIVFPKSSFLLSGAGVVLVFLLSALLSSNPQISLFGTMFDISSFWFIFSAFILMFMSSIVFRTPQRAKTVLFGVILSSFIVILFQSFHSFFPTALSLGILTDKASNILGSWNALGIFTGFSCLTFLLVIEFFPISKAGKIILDVFILLSILLAILINFSLVWILLGVFSLIIFVYKTSVVLHESESEERKKHFPIVSLVVVMISLLFFTSGTFILGFIPDRFQISNTEVTPDFSATMSIAKGVLVKNPVLGIGPNRFGEAWSMYKPLGINNTVINNTQFWDVSFYSGYGLLPTLATTTGGFGILALLAFFVLFLIAGVKSIFSSIKNDINWEMAAFFILSLYLLVSSVFYFTGVVIFLLFFAFSGIFVGLAVSGSHQEVSFSFLSDYRKSFFSILILVLIVVFSVVALFKYAERFTSVFYFERSLSTPTPSIAESSIEKALSLYTNDLYLRTFSQIYLIELNSIASKGSSLSDADKTDLQTILNKVVGGAEQATLYDPSSYVNFQFLGSVYQTAGTLGVKDAYSKAIDAYKTASSLNPINPGLKLSLANISFLNGSTKDAKDYANEALSLKSNYIDALIFLSQIAKSEGNNNDALSYARAALSFSPNDKNLLQYLNSLSNSPSSSPDSVSTTPNKSKQ